MEKYIAVLFAAHFIADFLLQPDSLVNKKEQSFLFNHSFGHPCSGKLSAASELDRMVGSPVSICFSSFN